MAPFVIYDENKENFDPAVEVGRVQRKKKTGKKEKKIEEGTTVLRRRRTPLADLDRHHHRDPATFRAL